MRHGRATSPNKQESSPERPAQPGRNQSTESNIFQRRAISLHPGVSQAQIRLEDPAAPGSPRHFEGQRAPTSEPGAANAVPATTRHRAKRCAVSQAIGGFTCAIACARLLSRRRAGDDLVGGLEGRLGGD